MHDSGIVRRIDDLGRVVIPKGIRKRLRIKNGDNLEISFTDDSIVIKKYDQVGKFKDIYTGIIDAFYRILGKDILLTNGDTYIYGAGKISGGVVNKEFSDEINNLIENRCEDLVGGEFFLTTDVKFSGQLFVSPLVVQGDIAGAVVLADESISEADITTIRGISTFICEYIE